MLVATRWSHHAGKRQNALAPGGTTPAEVHRRRDALTFPAQGPAERSTWAIGAVVARFVHTEEVTGSNPVSPTE